MAGGFCRNCTFHYYNSFQSQKHLIENLYHELKTPLSIIRGEIEITLNKKRDAEFYNHYVYKKNRKENILRFIDSPMEYS